MRQCLHSNTPTDLQLVLFGWRESNKKKEMHSISINIALKKFSKILNFIVFLRRVLSIHSTKNTVYKKLIWCDAFQWIINHLEINIFPRENLIQEDWKMKLTVFIVLCSLSFAVARPQLPQWSELIRYMYPKFMKYSVNPSEPNQAVIQSNPEIPSLRAGKSHFRNTISWNIIENTVLKYTKQHQLFRVTSARKCSTKIDKRKHR